MKSHHPVTVPAPALPGLAIAALEKIGVRLIRLTEGRLHASAIVRSFSAVDRVLVDWSIRTGGQLECQFEITYNDGYQISGDYRFKRKGSSRPALTRHVRASAQALCAGLGDVNKVRGLTTRALDFLEHYETDDACAI
ncbi:hypothetical protein [Telluria aromaticivorans]|uniref:Uncharacterized protein n=1 Tax=Telluria aromaticivorans TaxID=2725995 RepID=A0A7Y2NZP4_9BURK|nr:hypothetical protein [Telluria aromaticivorans]NNG22004.1 hypothetical protein [Telluria aromaticivorans]